MRPEATGSGEEGVTGGLIQQGRGLGRPGPARTRPRAPGSGKDGGLGQASGGCIQRPRRRASPGGAVPVRIQRTRRTAAAVYEDDDGSGRILHQKPPSLE
ncbi:hypothetical protein PVAP13_6KG148830 [Panicum virgatum]|uniref:Uncharacterized protein n=1 Tax=Panicum virgatum TaxID=38727 RepID=A0A8T0RDB4_PANVG|nr:hypothetical protein PVAP13_6KG148830 [Panicum virgatum]